MHFIASILNFSYVFFGRISNEHNFVLKFKIKKRPKRNQNHTNLSTSFAINCAQDSIFFYY